MNLRQRIAWRRNRFNRIQRRFNMIEEALEEREKDLRALAKQQEILLKRWADLHDRVVVLEEKA